MTINEIMKELQTVRKGTFTRVVYTSEPTLTAAARKQGVTVVKHVEKVVRFGVKYRNIKSVQEKMENEETKTTKRPAWCHWIVENILSKHNTKEDYYLSFAPTATGHHTKTTWYLNNKVVTRKEVEESGVVLPSYFKLNDTLPVIQQVKIENVLEIGGSRV